MQIRLDRPLYAISQPVECLLATCYVYQSVCLKFKLMKNNGSRLANALGVRRPLAGSGTQSLCRR